MIIPEKVYDILAWVNRVFLPAFGVLITSILSLCGVSADTVAIIGGIVLALTTFLGAILQDSKLKYEGEQNEN